MRISFDNFDWDESNFAKSFIKHNISPSQTEEVFTNENLLIFNDLKHSQKEKRYLAFGVTKDGLHLIVAFTIRSKNKKKLIRPISSRPMKRKEKVLYEKEISNIQK